MAEKRRPTPADIAQLVKRAPLEGRGFKLTLPVKADWPDPLFPIDKDKGAGVDPSGRETREGEQAMALRTLQEVEFAGYSLGDLMRDAMKRWGSTRTIAEQLVAMEHDPLRPGTELRNMQRKVQEWMQGKYTKPAGRNKRRVVRLMALFSVNLTLGVGGWWTIHDQKAGPREQYMEWHTPGRESTQGGHTRAGVTESNKYIRAARQVILNEGAGFVDLVLLSLQDQFAPYPVELESVHALYVEMSW